MGELRAAIAEFEGREVSSAGDGLMVVFPDSVADGLECAASMHRRVALLDPDDPPRLRIGISCGEVAQDGNEYSGMPIVEAARLEASAEPGKTLANAIVRSLVGTRRAFRFRDVGALSLKGIPEPLATIEVVDDEGGARGARLPARPVRAPDAAGGPSGEASPARAGRRGRRRRGRRARRRRHRPRRERLGRFEHATAGTADARRVHTEVRDRHLPERRARCRGRGDVRPSRGPPGPQQADREAGVPPRDARTATCRERQRSAEHRPLRLRERRQLDHARPCRAHPTERAWVRRQRPDAHAVPRCRRNAPSRSRSRRTTRTRSRAARPRSRSATTGSSGRGSTPAQYNYKVAAQDALDLMLALHIGRADFTASELVSAELFEIVRRDRRSCAASRSTTPPPRPDRAVRPDRRSLRGVRALRRPLPRRPRPARRLSRIWPR